jgi:hypothetical protein
VGLVRALTPRQSLMSRRASAIIQRDIRLTMDSVRMRCLFSKANVELKSKCSQIVRSGEPFFTPKSPTFAWIQQKVFYRL